MSPLTGAQFSKLLPWTTRPTLHDFRLFVGLVADQPRLRGTPAMLISTAPVVQLSLLIASKIY
jgi:hypothetical protein